MWLKGLVKKFTRNEMLVFGFLILAIIVSSQQIALSKPVADLSNADFGGVHIEGVIGKPRYINPLLAGTNAVDRDISRLVYSGLVKINPAREPVADLAERFEIQNGGRTYIFFLRKDVTWHDGQKFTADDVVYTFNVLQNESYAGVLKASFAGVAIEKVDDYVVKLTLPAPSTFFLTDLAVGIIPQHIFKDVEVKNFTNFYTAESVIGTGPYAYDNRVADESVSLKRYPKYYSEGYFLDRIAFFFYDNEETLAKAFQNRTVSAAGFTEVPTIPLTDGASVKRYRLPQYRGVFFNQFSTSQAIQDKAVRQALAFTVDKEQIIKEVENNNADRADSPVLAGFVGHKPDIKLYGYDIVKSAQLLQAAGWQDVDKDGYLEKDNARLSFRIAARDDTKTKEVVAMLQKNWKMLGAEIIVQHMDTATLIKDVIRPRNYDVLIFGQDLGANPDPYVYWHSSQVRDPGLALAVTVDKDIDNNLEAARTASDSNKAIGFYHGFQNAFAELVPAILLYTPRYTYIVDSKLRGVTDQINLSSTTDRFANLSQWHVKTK